MPDVPEHDQATVLRHEVETLGFLASRHPLSLYERRMEQVRAVRGQDLARHTGRQVRTVGWYVTGKVVNTRGDQQMEFVSFEDTSALYETTFFPDAYRKFCRMLTRTRPYLLQGRVEEEFGAVTLTVEHMQFLDEAAARPAATAAVRRRSRPGRRRHG